MIFIEPSNIYEHVECMRPRLGMFIGANSIKQLEAYLDGYCSALFVHRIEEQDRPSFNYFLDWLMLTRKGDWTRGWATALLDEANDDNDAALEKFFQLAGEFGELRSAAGESIDLPVGHQRSLDSIQFYRDNFPVPTRLQLVHLRPGDWCYLRYWYADKAVNQPSLYRDVSSALRVVESEFAITPNEWELGLSGR
ncbi:MAG: hypothetical protein ACHRXM_03760 [Isosphaerales bacterium]